MQGRHTSLCLSLPIFCALTGGTMAQEQQQPSPAGHAPAALKVIRLPVGYDVWAFSPSDEGGLEVRVTSDSALKSARMKVDANADIGEVVDFTAAALGVSQERHIVGVGLAARRADGSALDYWMFMSVGLPGGDSIMLTLQSLERPDDIETHVFVNHCPAMMKAEQNAGGTVHYQLPFDREKCEVHDGKQAAAQYQLSEEDVLEIAKAYLGGRNMLYGEYETRVGRVEKGWHVRRWGKSSISECPGVLERLGMLPHWLAFWPCEFSGRRHQEYPIDTLFWRLPIVPHGQKASHDAAHEPSRVGRPVRCDVLADGSVYGDRRLKVCGYVCGRV